MRAVLELLECKEVGIHGTTTANDDTGKTWRRDEGFVETKSAAARDLTVRMNTADGQSQTDQGN